MTVDKIEAKVRGLHICNDEKSLCFQAAVILLYSLYNDTKSVQKIKKGTEYHLSDVELIMSNFWKNGLISYETWHVEYLIDNPLNCLECIIELTMFAMAGAGEVRTHLYQLHDPRYNVSS